MKYVIVFVLASIAGFGISFLTTASKSLMTRNGTQSVARENITMNDSENRIVCSLSAADWKDRQGVLRELSKGVIQRKELENGFAWGFPAEASWFSAITEVVSLERQCCEFLSFKIVVEANKGPIWLEISGVEGSKEFLRKQLGIQTEPSLDD